MEIQVIVLRGHGSAMQLIQSVEKNPCFQLNVLESVGDLEACLQSPSPALVILPMELREDLFRVVPIIRTAMKIKTFSKVRFLAVSDLVKKAEEIPAVQNTVRMLQGLMDFVPLTFTSDHLRRKIEEQLREFRGELLQAQAGSEYVFLKGRESPRNFKEVQEAYQQGIQLMSEAIQASECVLLTLDTETKCYQAVNSTRNGQLQEGWDGRSVNIIPRRDVISSRGYHYFQPIRDYVVNEKNEHSCGFLYVLRENAKSPLNSDQISCVKTLTQEIENLSQAYLIS